MISELKESGIKKATLLQIKEDSKAQVANIGARACEVAILRLFDSPAFKKLKVERAESKCIMKDSRSSTVLNEGLRRNAEVVLYGDLGAVDDELGNSIVTSGSKLGKTSFDKILKKHGSIEKVPLDAFTVSELVLIDTKNGEVHKFS